MRVLLLHVSDLHCPADYDNRAIDRGVAIGRTALGQVPGVEAVLLVFTGDLVDRGETSALEAVSVFFDEIKVGASQAKEGVHWLGEVLVPGNHDTHRPTEPQAAYTYRKAMEELEEREFSGQIEVEPAAMPVRILLDAQKPFFDFEAGYSGRDVRSPEARLAWKQLFLCGSRTIEVLALNTSWMSKDDTDQGRLLMWCPDLEQNDGSTFRVVAMHHPFNWIHRDNARLYQADIQEYADLILSGHEHVGQDFVRHSEGTEETICFEGFAIAEAKKAPQFGAKQQEGFAALLLDFGTMHRTTFVFYWDGKEYVRSKPKDAVPLRSSIEGRSDGFVIVPKFQSDLEDPGLTPHRKRGARLRLEDVFVYPRLKEMAFEGSPQSEAETRTRKFDSSSERPGERIGPSFTVAVDKLDPIVSSAHVLKEHEANRRMLIVGDPRSGKTTLLKKYFADLRMLGFVPVMLRPSDLHATTIDELQVIVRQRVEQQYGDGAGEKFFSLPQAKRVVLVDDVDRANLTSAELRVLLERFDDLSGKTIISSDELFILNKIWADFQGSSNFLSYRIYRILLFDPRQNREMAAKMMDALLERTKAFDAGSELARLERDLEAILGDTLLMPSPCEVKLVLRDLIDGQHAGAEYGAYGFYYDRQIKNDIADGLKQGKDAQELSADFINSFLTDLAYLMYTPLNKSSVTANEFDQLVDRFREEYHNVYHEALIDALVRCRLLVFDGFEFRFRERYQRYFFLACKLRDMLGEDETRDKAKDTLQDLVESMYEQESADIVLFTFYLTRSKWLIDTVRYKAANLMTEFDECDMEGSFAWLYGKKKRKKAGDCQEPAPASGVVLDVYGEEYDSAGGVDLPDEIERDELLAKNIKRMNEAFNALMILGQAVRNYPTKIDPARRRALIEESYALSLRAATCFLGMIKEGRQELRMLARKHLRVDGRMTVESPELVANTIAMKLATLCMYGIVRRVVSAVGSPQLEALLVEIWRDTGVVSKEMVRMGVLLDLRRINERQLDRFFVEMEDNPIAQNVLRNVVANHLRTYRADFERRLAFAGAVKLDPTHPALFYSKDKPRALGES